MSDPRDVLTRSVRGPDAVLAYGPGPDQVGEVWWPRPSDRPSAEPTALILVIHGGFWQLEWDRVHARPMAVALAEAGYVVGSVEYRRIGSPDGGGWPGTFDDIAAAVDQLPEMIMDLAPDHVRTEGVVLIGHSAGGHLALWASARHRLPGGSTWHRSDGSLARGVVALAPVAQLARADREGVGEGAVAQLVGGPATEVPDRYDLADPSSLVPSGVPTMVVHGSIDEWVPIEHSRSFVQDARAAGEDITLVELVGVEHFGVIDPLSTAWVDVLDAIRGVAGSLIGIGIGNPTSGNRTPERRSS